MKSTIIILAMLIASVSAQAFSLKKLEKAKKALGLNEYVCVVHTSFDGDFTGERSNSEKEARASAQNACRNAGVSWMWCDNITCDQVR